MRKVIIGIHGLGNKPGRKSLKKWWKASIVEGLSLFAKRKIWFKYEQVYWADFLHNKPLETNIKDKKNTSYVKYPYISALWDTPKLEKQTVKEWIDSVLRRIKEKVIFSRVNPAALLGIEEKLIKEKFPDLYKYYNATCKVGSKEYPVKDLIRGSLVKIIRKYRNRKILIIAHSMGSLISMDVFLKIIKDINIDIFITIGSPLGLPTVKKNIVHENTNLKIKLKTPDNILSKWYNFYDLKDPIAAKRKLAESYKENINKVKPKDIIVKNKFCINQHQNHHKSFGYLSTKQLGKVVFEFLSKDKMSVAEKILKFFRKK